RFTPAVLAPLVGTQNLQFDLSTYQSQSVTLTVRFLNQSSMSVLRTITRPQSPGTGITVTWDGKSDNGMWVAPGTYTAIISVVDGIGNTATLQGITTVMY